MNAILSLPEPVRLGFAFMLVLLLPAVFLALCAPVVRRTRPQALPGVLLDGLVVGVPLLLLVWLALRQSVAVLVGSLIAAAVFLLVPVLLSRIARWRTGQSLPPLAGAVRFAVALFVPLFFLYAGAVAELLRVHFPHVYVLPL